MAGDTSPSFAVIFDMDGVLVDSMDFVLAQLNTLVRPHGLELSHHDAPLFIGIGTDGVLEILDKKFGVRLDRELFEQELLHVPQDVKADARVRRLIEELQSRHVPLAVGTSSSRERALGILRSIGLAHAFRAISTATDVKRAKPAPDVYLHAAKSIGMHPSHCVVIEDTPAGIEAARAAGMKSVGLVTRYGTPSLLAHADMVIHGLHELSYETLRQLFEK